MNNKAAQFAKDNLGKEVVTRFGKGLIVGNDDEYVIIGFYNSGSWTYIHKTDKILISSPMIKSYLYICVHDVIFV